MPQPVKRAVARAVPVARPVTWIGSPNGVLRQGRDHPGPDRGDHRRQLRAHRRVVRRQRGARRVRHRPTVDLRRARPRRERPRPRADRRRHREGRPGRHLGAQLRGVDDRAVRHRQGRRDPGQRQPVLPHPRVLLRGEPVGAAAADQRGVVQDQRLPRDGRGGRRATEPQPLERVVYIGTDDWDALVAEGEGLPRTRWRERMSTLEPGDADQHPVHERHHRLPQGRHAEPPQHPQQRLLHHRADQLHRRGPALHPGALLPLLRHGDGQPRLHHPRRHDGDPGARASTPRRRCVRGRGALHRPVRRADDVHRDAEPPDLRRPRPRPACAPA